MISSTTLLTPFTSFTIRLEQILRICSGKYTKGMKIRHVRLQRDLQISNALTFMAGNREQADEAWAGDVIGLHNHGTIQVGDTFTQGEKLTFSGIPYFAPELFKIVIDFIIMCDH